jgi:hypothetical protein
MGQVLHGCATTTEAIRRTIQNSQESLRALSKRYGINPKTVAKWKKRGSVTDLPTGPKEPKSTSLSLGDEAIIGREKRSKVEPEELSGNLIVQLGSVTEELNIPARWHPQPNDQYPIWAGPGCLGRPRVQRTPTLSVTIERNSYGAWAASMANCTNGATVVTPGFWREAIGSEYSAPSYATASL